MLGNFEETKPLSMERFVTLHPQISHFRLHALRSPCFSEKKENLFFPMCEYVLDNRIVPRAYVLHELLDAISAARVIPRMLDLLFQLIATLLFATLPIRHPGLTQMARNR